MNENQIRDLLAGKREALKDEHEHYRHQKEIGASVHALAHIKKKYRKIEHEINSLENQLKNL